MKIFFLIALILWPLVVVVLLLRIYFLKKHYEQREELEKLKKLAD